MNYIKSPLNYTGGKYKLLPDIMHLIPRGINTFVDLFCGGGDVTINTEAKRIIANDINSNVCNILSMFSNMDKDYVFSNIDGLIARYGLSDVSKYGYEYYGCESNSGLGSYNGERYNRMRNDFNNMSKEDKNYYITLFTIILFSFNNQIRFNGKGEFNMPVGKRDFNKNSREKLNAFMERIKKINLEVINKDFRSIDMETLTCEDFVYCDPPYLITCATYNENGGWTQNDENDLYDLLDTLDGRNIRFAVSNVFENKGKVNESLVKWSEKYNVVHLNKDYHNCNYHSIDKSLNTTDEVLIMNYKNEELEETPLF